VSTADVYVGAGPAGQRLWRSITDAYDLDEHELALLLQACRTADTCEDLQALVDAEGLLLNGRSHPALVELRLQRVLLARLLVALRVPLADESEQPVTAAGRTQRRGTRGVYAPRAVS
jgi:hypothetical protein